MARMCKMLCTRGYSGSGKSYWAKEWLAENTDNRVITSRDDLRATLFNGEGILSQQNETLITKIQHEIVKNAIEAGKDVVIHDTHLRAKYLRDWADFAADLGADFEVKDFKTDVDICVNRNYARAHDGTRWVKEDVIRSYAKRFPVSQWKEVKARPKETLSLEPYQEDESLWYTIIVDIDGTIASFNNRGPFEFNKVSSDLPKKEIIKIVKLLSQEYHVIFFSGREAKDFVYDDTVQWLIDHVDIGEPELYMRKAGDFRKDSEVKLELFNRHVRGKYNVAAVIDDRLQVVRMWHKLGLPVFRVGDPDAKF